jgi:hypothetical protein
MKHQYFGDINDYRKYGLLRTLRRDGDLRLGVCWMLTADDGRSDGRFTTYLSDPLGWRHHDPHLFDALACTVPVRRHLDHVQTHELIPEAVFVDAAVPQERQQRAQFFEEAHERLAATDVVFYDPDNGIEIPSCPVGRSGSNKYVLWSEIERTYTAGASVLIYQHFRREKRNAFVARMARELRHRTEATSVMCFRTANVAFFLLGQQRHAKAIERAIVHLNRAWGEQIQVWADNRLAKLRIE